MSLAKLATVYNKLKQLTVQRPQEANISFADAEVDVLDHVTGEWAKKRADGTIVRYDDYASAVCTNGTDEQKAMMNHRKYMMQKDGLTNKVQERNFHPNVQLITDLDSQHSNNQYIMKDYDRTIKHSRVPHLLPGEKP